MKTTTKIAGISSLILLSIFLLTDPQELPSVFLIAPFVLLFVALFSGVAFLLSLHAGLPKAIKLRVGLVAASVPVILLILQSLGQLTVRDVLVIGVLFCVAYFYISRLRVPSAG